MHELGENYVTRNSPLMLDHARALFWRTSIMFPHRMLMTCALAAAGFCLAGCSDPYSGRKEVSGTVTMKGQPIKDGALIEFAPLEDQSTGANAAIQGGAYKLPRENGLLPGKYLVRVTLGDGKTPVEPADPDTAPGPQGGSNIVSKDLVPPDWNVQSKQQVTVTKDGPNKFDFAIP